MKKAAFKGITVVFTILLAFSFIIMPANSALTWTVEKVLSDSSIREGCSLVLDSAGNPWISYNVKDGLKVAHFTGAKWETEDVDDSGDAISAIAINGEGEPVIVYQDSINSRIEYAERVGTKWQISTVDGECGMTCGISLATDPTGYLHVAYIDCWTVALKYASLDGSVLENVTALRSQWMSTAQSGNLDAINNATTQLESGVSSMMVTFENYPNLQASGVIQSLMITLEGTENRISTERMRYNEAVRDYNTAIASFPGSLWSAGWGYTAKPYFQAQVGSTEVPSVTF